MTTLDKIYSYFDEKLNNEQKITFCMTVLGISAELTEFIMKHKDFLEIPHNIHYAMLLTSGNMLAMMGISAPLDKLDITDMVLPPKDKLIMVLKHMNEVYADDLK